MVAVAAWADRSTIVAARVAELPIAVAGALRPPAAVQTPHVAALIAVAAASDAAHPFVDGVVCSHDCGIASVVALAAAANPTGTTGKVARPAIAIPAMPMATTTAAPTAALTDDARSWLRRT